jgi:hypothetical protein
LPLIFMSHADHRRRMAEAIPRNRGHLPAHANDDRGASEFRTF